MQSNQWIPRFYLSLLAFLWGASSWAQTDALALSSATAASGGPATLSLTLTSPSGSEPAGVQWMLTYATSDITAINATVGTAGTAAGKSLTCASGIGTYTCVLAGINSSTIQNGQIATVNVTLSPTVTSGTSIEISGPLGASLAGSAVALTGSGGSITVGSGTAPTVSSVSCTPGSVNTPGTGNCTVTLNAQSNSAQVAISSNNTNFSVPASITIPSGASSASFSASASPVTSNQTAMVTATLGSSSQVASVTLVAAATASSMVCTPATVNPSATSACTVTLNQTASASVAVSLSSNNSIVSVPASVNIPAGVTSASFTATVGTFGNSQTAVLTATVGASSQTTSLTLTPVTTVTSLACTPLTLSPAATSACTVTLNQAATANLTVGLSSSTSYLGVPPSVSIAAGAASANFTATAGPFNTNQTAVITASLGSSSQSVSVSLVQSASTAPLQCAPATLNPLATTNCTLTMSPPAPSHLKVSLSSNNPLVAVPGTLTIWPGGTAASFTATAGPFTTNQAAVLSASWGSTPQTTTLSLVVAEAVSSLVCGPTTLSPAGTSACTVTLNQSAPSGLTIGLSSNNSALSVPFSVSITAGATSANFTATAGSFSSNQTAVVTATLGSSSLTASMVLAVPATVSGVSCTPSTLNPAGSSACTVTLNQAASSSVTVGLSSSTTALAVPASVGIASGASTAGFTAAAGTFTSNQTATIKATLGSSSATASIPLVVPLALSSLVCTPATLNPSGTSTCTVTLSQAAPANFAVNPSSNNSAVSVPGSVSVATGAMTASFSATAGNFNSSQTAVITAASGSSSQIASLSLVAPLQPTSLQCAPLTVNPGGVSSCTVTLNQAAPVNMPVSLASNNTALTVPVTVSVAAGATTATFTATASTFTTNQTAVVTAGLSGVNLNATINLSTALGITSLQCTPAYLDLGQAATCTIALTGAAPTGGSQVALTESSTGVTVPSTVTVPAGSTSASFTAQNGTTGSQGTVTLSATLGGSSQSFVLTTVTVGVSTLTCKSASLTTQSSTTCTVTMTRSASQVSVNLRASVSGALNIPSSVTIKGWNGNFTVTPTGTYLGSLTLTASFVGTSQNVLLSVQAAASKQASISCPAGLSPGAAGQCTAQLNGDAPPGGASIGLHSDNPHLHVPERVFVPAGARTAAFSIRSAAADQDEEAHLSAIANGSSTTTRISLAGLRIDSLSCAPKTAYAGQIVQCVARLNAPPAGALELSTASNYRGLLAPAVIATRAQQQTITFRTEVAPDARQRETVLEARLGNSAAREHIILLPSRSPALTLPGTKFIRPGETLEFPVSASDGQDLPVRITASGLPRGASFGADSHTFAWIPDNAQTGAFDVAFTAINSPPASRTGHVIIQVGYGKPLVQEVRNAASQSSGAAACSPGALASVTGGWLFNGEPVRLDGAGLTEFGGTRVRVNGEPAELVYVSATRIDFVCPTMNPGSLRVSVETAEGASEARVAATQDSSPGIFSADGSGQGQGHIISGNSRLAIARNYRYAGEPAAAGDIVALRVTGVPSMLGARVLIGGVDAEVRSIHPVPGLAGVSEIEVRVPDGAPLGDEIPVSVEMPSTDGRVVRGNTVTMAVEGVVP